MSGLKIKLEIGGLLMLNREKFLAHLGISSNWKIISRNGVTNIIDEKSKIFYCYEAHFDMTKNRNLAFYSSVMLCDMVESAMQFLFYANEHAKKGRINKMQINSTCANKLLITIEKVTGKLWEEVHKIALACQE